MTDVVCIEGAFPVPRGKQQAVGGDVASGAVYLAGGRGASGICDISGGRTARIVPGGANSNLEHPHTDVPALVGRYSAGVVWLTTAVLGMIDADRFVREWVDSPRVVLNADSVTIHRGSAEPLRVAFSAWSAEASPCLHHSSR